MYHNSNTSNVVTPVNGDPKDSLQEIIFILPNGSIWTGPVHKMNKNEWMTGSFHTNVSVPLFAYQTTLDFPKQGSVATSTPLNKVLETLGIRTEVTESNLLRIGNVITTARLLLEQENQVVHILADKLEQFISKSIIQEETNGSGSLTDSFSTPFQLESDSPQNLTEQIKSIEYIPNNDEDHLVYFGNAETLGLSETWTSLKTNSIAVDMVSRRNLSIETIAQTSSGNGVDIPSEEFRTVPDGVQKGFNGHLKISMNGSPFVNKIKLNTQSDVTIRNIRFNSVESDDELSGSAFSGELSLVPTAADIIYMDIDFVSPVPFTTYGIYDQEENAVTDLIFMPNSDYNMEFSPSGLNAIYERSRLILDPIYLLSETYRDTTEYTLGDYYCKGGSLKSIYMITQETIPDEFEPGTFIKYFLILNEKEYPITPQNKIGDNPSTYVLNSTLGSEIKNTLVQKGDMAFIEGDNTITWQIKVILTRPSTQTNMTPSLSAINFTYTTTSYDNLVE